MAEPTPPINDDQAVTEDDDGGEERSALSGLHTVSAPPDFAAALEEKIRSRSDGRFFGPKSLRDRIPIAALALVAMILAGVLVWLLRSAPEGVPAIDPSPDKPTIDPAAGDVIPRP